MIECIYGFHQARATKLQQQMNDISKNHPIIKLKTRGPPTNHKTYIREGPINVTKKGSPEKKKEIHILHFK